MSGVPQGSLLGHDFSQSSELGESNKGMVAKFANDTGDIRKPQMDIVRLREWAKC